MLQLAEEKEKWEEERREKEKELLDVRHLMEEQRRESKNEVKALLEKQVQAVEEATEKLKKSHQLEINDLMGKHQQEVGLRKGTKFKGHLFYKLKMVFDFMMRAESPRTHLLLV